MNYKTHADKVAFLLEGKPVISLTGKKVSNKSTLLNDITIFFNSINKNAASPVYGNIELTHRSGKR